MSDAAISNQRSGGADKPAGIGLRQRLFIGLGTAVVLVALIVGGWWLLVGRNFVSTDDAYVQASTAQITPRVDGTLATVPVRDTDHVRRGQVLATIDPADAQLAVQQAEANLAQTQQKVAQYFDNVASGQAQVNARQADLARAKVDYDRRAALAATGAVSGDELTTARNSLDTAQATVDQAHQQLAAQRAMVVSGSADSNPEIQAARVALSRAKLDLERTVIRAPIDGIVAQNTAQIGQRVQAGASLMTVAPVAGAYVNANFKENQSSRPHPSRPGGESDLRSLRLRCGVPRPCDWAGRRHRLGLLHDPGAERHRQLDQGGAAPAGAHRARSR